MCRILFAIPVTSLFPEHKQFISHSGSWSIFPCYKGAKVTNLPNLLFNFVLFLHYRWSLFLHLDWFSLRAVWPFLFPSNSNGSRLYTSPILQCLFGMFWHTRASGTTGICFAFVSSEKPGEPISDCRPKLHNLASAWWRILSLLNPNMKRGIWHCLEQAFMCTEDTPTACISRISMLTMPTWSFFFHGHKDPAFHCLVPRAYLASARVQGQKGKKSSFPMLPPCGGNESLPLDFVSSECPKIFSSVWLWTVLHWMKSNPHQCNPDYISM